mmetsp:Transcript_655/g.1753  ORF Transcript_655/g.1753 Transcript_655/m.1753 type:complete len:136 (-) Transcript_655:2607-3014(-)
MASVSVCFRSSAHSARACVCSRSPKGSLGASCSRRGHSSLYVSPRLRVRLGASSEGKSSASSSSSSSSSNESSYSIASFSLDRKTTSTPNELLRVYDADAVNLQKSASLIFTYLILGILLYLTVDLATNPQALRP